jgi:flagellar basal body rod protein FlgF
LIRRVPLTETLVSIEPANQVIPKVGVTGQWLKVRDASGKEGYVAAWYVKYASGSQPANPPAAATAPVNGGPLKVKATVEAIALRRQPIVSDMTLIKRLPLGTVFTVTELNAEGKIGRNDQWLKVKDPAGAEGYVAAWFVAR